MPRTLNGALANTDAHRTDDHAGHTVMTLHRAAGPHAASAFDDDEVTRVLAALQVRCERAAGAAGFALGRRAPLAAAAAPFVVRYNPATHPEPLTLFHSSQLLPMTLRQLFDGVRARRGMPFENANAMMAAVLVDRFARATGLPVTALMMHRLFVTALLVSAKVHNDRFAANVDVARAVSMTLQELNDLEMELLVALRFRCLVDADGVERLRHALGLAGIEKEACVEPAAAREADADFVATATVASGEHAPNATSTDSSNLPSS